MDLGKKRALVVKKAATLRIKSGGSSALLVKVKTKRKPLSERKSPLKRMSDTLTGTSEGSSQRNNPPCHGVGKGLMTTQGPIALSSTRAKAAAPPPLSHPLTCL